MRLQLTIGILISVLIGTAGLTHYASQQESSAHQPLIATERPCTKTIDHTIEACGTLELPNSMKIGSNVSGIVKELYVDENTLVTKGQKLAEIDPGTGTTDYDKAQLAITKAQQEYSYLKKNTARMAALYKTNQLAQDAFEKLVKDTEKSRLDVAIAEVDLVKQKIDLENRVITAPENGIITQVLVSRGEGVTGSSYCAMQLFELAADIATMQAKIDIDENDIGLINKDQLLTLTINADPDTPLQSTIKSISFSPRATKDAATGCLVYRALARVPNVHKKLRPGMGLTATIHINKIPNALCIKSLALEINEQHLAAATLSKNITLQPMNAAAKTAFRLHHASERVKFIWLDEKEHITERGVILGVMDDTHVQIKEGLSVCDAVITQVREPVEQKTLVKRLFSRI